MRKTILVDDLDGESTPAETMPFQIGLQKWEIDLTDANREALQATLTALAGFVSHARTVTEPAVKPRTRKSRAKSAQAPRERPRQVRLTAEQTTAIRAWAAENGHTAAERGPLPASVVNAYNEAQAATPAAPAA